MPFAKGNLTMQNLGSRSRLCQGFTLIELMVVVTIIAIVASVGLPALSNFLAKARNASDEGKQAARLETPMAMPAQDALAPSSKPSPQGRGIEPQVREIDLEVQLTTHHRVIGVGVYAWFDALVLEDMVLSTDEPDKPIQLIFPFPPGTVQANQVSLLFKQPDGSFVEPASVSYQARGVVWSGPPPGAGRFTVRLTYGLRGQDRFVYHLPGQGRTDRVRVRMAMDQASETLVPPEGLQPTRLEPGTLSWEFRQWVTDKRTIIVEMPTVDTPMGRAAVLGRLAAVGVLLFGAGFWYLSDCRKPGALDSFRWGHFLLLSLTYSLFFFIFELLVLRFELAIPGAMVVAAGVSLPMLAWHVARNSNEQTIDWRFALFRIIPMAALSLLLVVVGVFGGAWREAVFAVAAVVILGYFTATYRQWATGRRNHREAIARAIARSALERKARQPLETIAQHGYGAQAREAERLLTQLRERGIPAIELTRLHESWRQCAADLGALEQALAATAALAEETAYRNRTLSLQQRGEDLVKRWQDLDDRLRQEIVRERALLERSPSPAMATPPSETAAAGSTRCLACGQSGPRDGLYCCRCGERMPVRLSCACGGQTLLPVHLLPVWPPQRPVHCLTCGQVLDNSSVGEGQGADAKAEGAEG